MNKLPTRLLAFPVALLGIGAVVVAGFTEPTPPEPTPGQEAIGHWEGYPFIPSDIGDAVNTRLPKDYQRNGRMFIDLYQDDQTGDNYGKVNYTLATDIDMETTVMCTPKHELDFGIRLTRRQIFGQTVVHHAVVEHTKPGDLAERTCGTGELTAAACKHLPAQMPLHKSL